MKLDELIKHVPITSVRGGTDLEVSDFHFDSRKITAGTMFVAVKGVQTDGHKFIDKAIDNGASAIICEQLPEQLADKVTYLIVQDSQAALADIAAAFYGFPATKLKIVGITGTNGKTTTVTLLHRLFTAMGHTCGLVSTIRYVVGEQVLASSHTTPDPKKLQALFAEMVKAGCSHCFMEVSSHALVQDRVKNVPFDIAVFTNITHDHLDYHGDFKGYIQAKKLLFDQLGKEATALINHDDKNGKVMVQNTSGKVKTFALKRMADYKARIIDNTFEGLFLDIADREVWCKMTGSFNAYNLLTAYAVAMELGLEQEQVLLRLSELSGADGRFETLRSGKSQLIAIVDYAHTPDALKNVLQTINDINQHNANIITVVGCGGDRDITKRPRMAAIATAYSDQVLLTSDNPRSEEPDEIIEQMYKGVQKGHQKKVLRITNRREAIKTACQLASAGDIILVAGKGHEDYQEIKGVKHPFDDKKVLKEIFEMLDD